MRQPSGLPLPAEAPSPVQPVLTAHGQAHGFCPCPKGGARLHRLASANPSVLGSIKNASVELAKKPPRAPSGGVILTHKA